MKSTNQSTSFRTLVGRTVLWCCFLLLSNTVVAQEKPMQNVTKFDKDVYFRTDVCDRQTELYQNNLKIADALQGKNLSVAFTKYTQPYEDRLFNLDKEGRLPVDKPGLFVIIMDELASRAGFTWRDTFVALEPMDPEVDTNRTWSDMLKWSIDTFDISVDNWAKTVKRMRRGVAFPEGWYDSSLVIVERIDPSSQDVDMWSFLTPFQSGVWIMLVVAILATGVLYWMLEQLNRESDTQQLEKKPLTTIFLSALTFVGHFDFSPGTHSARLLALSYTFFTLIMVSAYTANLASFLVARQTPNFSIESLSQAVRLDIPVCIQASSNHDEIISEMYPGINLVRKRFEGDVFMGVKNGECRIAVVPVNTYEVYVRTNTINKDCSLKSDKRVITILNAGIATAFDSGSNCTSLIDNVIDLHMTQMKADGFIESAWNNHLSKIGDSSCLAEEATVTEQELKGGGDPENVSLSLEEMAGIFILHAGLSALAMIVSLVRFFIVKRKNPEEMLAKLGVSEEGLKESFGLAQQQDEVSTTLGSGGSSENQKNGQNARASPSVPPAGFPPEPISGPNQYWDP